MLDATALDIQRLSTKTYTLCEIDAQIEIIRNIIIHGKKRNKADCFLQIDTWLDRRNEVVSKANG